MWVLESSRLLQLPGLTLPHTACKRPQRIAPPHTNAHRNVIAERYGVTAPATLVFDHPTLAALSTWLAAQLAPAAAARGSGGTAGPVTEAELQLSVHQQQQQDSTAGVTAVVGAACCFPGISSSSGGSGSGGDGGGLGAFWAVAAAGVGVQALIPLSKWDAGESHSCCCFKPSKQPLHTAAPTWLKTTSCCKLNPSQKPPPPPAFASFPPSSCLQADASYDPDTNAAASGALTTYARFAATLDGGVAAFDAAAFRLTRAEAALMDPQGRLLLEQAAEAVQDARQRRRLPQEVAAAAQHPLKISSGGDGGEVCSASTGVYVGCMWATGEELGLWVDGCW
jgi:hypothetical protein